MARKQIENAVSVLRGGGIVVFPTDTVYGLLADAKNPEAIEKLIALKARPAGKPISVFVKDFVMMNELTEIPETDMARLKELLPGPYTVVLRSKHTVSNLLESEKGTLGVRIPDYPDVRELVERFAGPVTATSANRSGHPPVHSIAALMNQLNDEQKKMIDLVVDAGELPRNKPSTVIDLTGDSLKVLREGDVRVGHEKMAVSKSPEETQEIAKKILKELDPGLRRDDKPVVMILKGDLGAGKTQFVKGIGRALNIEDRITSPTFVVYYEYPVKNGEFKKLVHVDLYNIQEPEEFKHLGLEEYLKDRNLLCIEWGEKSAEIIETLREKASLIYIHIDHVDEMTRKITMKS